MQEDQIHTLLKEVFGHSEFRHNQKSIIDSVINGKDTLAIMPTGGGKSACYQIPALAQEGVCVVISPLISLMHDQVANLKQLGVKSCFLNSAQNYSEKDDLKLKIKQGEIKIVYISPESMLQEYMIQFLKSLKINLIAIDEAHCVSGWGHEFREDYRKLGVLKQLFPDIPILALTATADAKTREDIVGQLNMQSPAVFISSFDRPNIKYLIEERDDEISQLKNFIKTNHPDDTGIVYCLSRKKTEKIAQKLKELGFNAYAYHAGMTSKERSRIQKKFNLQVNIIIVATVAFGMGIDRPDVRFVAHLDLPKSIEGYYQETGRAGRDGEPASAWMIYGLSDVVKHGQMLETTDASAIYKQVARAKLDAMLSLCESTGCRRKILVNYFEQDIGDECGNCDGCLSPAETWDATKAAQKLLSAIYHTQGRFGANYIVDLLRGSQNSKVLERGHDKLSVYSIGADIARKDWLIVTRQLLSKGFIHINNWEFRTIGLAEKSRQLLKGQETLLLRKRKDDVSKPQKVRRDVAMESHGREELFERLRILRKEIAARENVPPYIVFNDKSLHEMCVFMPKSPDEFLMVAGVGKSKLERYGNEFIKEIGAR